MATYKSEFNAHYYQGRLRPRAHYSMGLIHYWSRLAAKAPAVANRLAGSEHLGALAKALAGIAPERELPPYAAQTLQQWFKARARRTGNPQVLLFPDTFNNHFRPEVGRAAVEVLEWAGYEVVMPMQRLCCARPMYDIGMLRGARRLLARLMAVLDPWVSRGVPVLGLEPACVAAFRDELPNLFPDDPRARRLAKGSYLLTEFLGNQPRFEPPKLSQRAMIHTHCHHHAIIGRETENRLLDAMGLDYQLLDSGCCGMAGAFGFEADHYQVSMKAAERALLPAVRAAPEDALIITNGFSCAEQVRQGAGVRPLHTAELLWRAITAGANSGITGASGQAADPHAWPL